MLPLSLIAWYALKLTIGVRVSAAEELQGLDIGEHGMEAYPGFGTDAVGETAEEIALGQKSPAMAGAPVGVVQEELVGQDARLQAWRWYWINGRVTSSDYVAKVYTALDRLTGRGDDSAVVVVYTPMSDARDMQAGATLGAFVSDMAPAIAARLEATRGH